MCCRLSTTIRGGGKPAIHQWLHAADEIGPTAKELRPDAHGCIMVPILPDRRIQGAARLLDLRASCELPSGRPQNKKERAREK
jgi:hypothetical protein